MVTLIDFSCILSITSLFKTRFVGSISYDTIRLANCFFYLPLMRRAGETLNDLHCHFSFLPQLIMGKETVSDGYLKEHVSMPVDYFFRF